MSTLKELVQDIHQGMYGVPGDSEKPGLIVIVDRTATKSKNHEDTLYGNGQPGICKRVNVMETKQEQHLDAADKEPARSSACVANWISAIAVLIAAAALLYSLFR